jgi:hypothetical protein
MRDSAAAIRVKLSKPRLQPEQQNQLQSTLSNYTAFLTGLSRQLFANLFEGASFVRRVTVLEMLTHLHAVVGFGEEVEGGGRALNIGRDVVCCPGVALVLYDCLEDSYEENRMAALNILKGIYTLKAYSKTFSFKAVLRIRIRDPVPF